MSKALSVFPESPGQGPMTPPQRLRAYIALGGAADGAWSVELFERALWLAQLAGVYLPSQEIRQMVRSVVGEAAPDADVEWILTGERQRVEG